MYVYILRCNDDSLYTGIAADIEKRMRQHRQELKGGAKYTKSHGVKKLEVLWKTNNNTAARKMEYSIKQLKRSQKEELILCPYLITEKFIPSLAEYEFQVVGIEATSKNLHF